MATKTNKDYFFCSAQVRPKMCLYENNKCCHNCDKIEECIGIHKTARIKTIPCKDLLEENEICEFMI